MLQACATCAFADWQNPKVKPNKVKIRENRITNLILKSLIKNKLVVDNQVFVCTLLQCNAAIYLKLGSVKFVQDIYKTIVIILNI